MNYISVTEMCFRVLVAFEVISIVNLINYSYLKVLFLDTDLCSHYCSFNFKQQLKEEMR